MSEPTDKQLPEEQLDEYLQGDSSVSRQYRQLHSADVPAELDRLVLRQAHDAVKAAPAKSRPESRPNSHPNSHQWMRQSMKWSRPLALAASAVLVISIVIETGVHDEVILTAEKVSAPGSAPVEAKRRAEAVQNDAAEELASEAPVAPQFVPPRDVAVPESAASAPVELVMPEPAPPPPPAAVTVEGQQPAPKPAVAPAETSRREQRDAPASQTIAHNSPTFVPPDDLQSAPEQARPAAESDRAFRAGQSRAAGPRDTVAVPSAASASDQSQALPQYTDPELWLRDIRELRKNNQQQQADREWRRFREAFPDHPVSDNDAAREVRN